MERKEFSKPIASSVLPDLRIQMIGWAACYQLIGQLKKAFVEEGRLA
jgi:hypothetical protein